MENETFNGDGLYSKKRKIIREKSYYQVLLWALINAFLLISYASCNQQCSDVIIVVLVRFRAVFK